MKLQQFDPIIYPRLVWIGVYTTIEAIKERFKILNKADEDAIRKIDYHAIGCRVRAKDNNRLGILLLLRNKTLMVSTMAHEAVHIADYIFEEIGACSQDFTYTNEPYAYLVGWAADCINRVKLNRNGK